MTYALIAAPAAMPVTLAQAKAHLRVTSTTEDELISGLVETATQYLERDTGLALINQQWRAWFDRPPADGIIRLLRHPVRAIVSVTVYDGDGNPAVLAGSDYYLNLAMRPPRLRLKDSVSAQSRANGIEIDFDAGFGETGVDVPDILKRAILVLVAHWYEFRGAFDAADQPVSVPMLYARLTRTTAIRAFDDAEAVFRPRPVAPRDGAGGGDPHARCAWRLCGSLGGGGDAVGASGSRGDAGFPCRRRGGGDHPSHHPARRPTRRTRHAAAQRRADLRDPVGPRSRRDRPLCRMPDTGANMNLTMRLTLDGLIRALRAQADSLADERVDELRRRQPKPAKETEDRDEQRRA
jgi:uncharacterized phiE125 gp8 family phage protein